MKKEYRIKREIDFQKVFDEGQNMANRQFVVYTLKKSDQSHYRVGISVGKKIGNAVVRNKVKRRIRASIQHLGHRLRPNLDFIVIARQPTRQMTQQDIESSLIHLFKLADIFISEER